MAKLNKSLEMILDKYTKFIGLLSDIISGNKSVEVKFKINNGKEGKK